MNQRELDDRHVRRAVEVCHLQSAADVARKHDWRLLAWLLDRAIVRLRRLPLEDDATG